MPEQKKLRGLEKLCKLYGSIKAGSIVYVWDYAADEPVTEAEMKPGGERWMSSERAKWMSMANDIQKE